MSGKTVFDTKAHERKTGNSASRIRPPNSSRSTGFSQFGSIPFLQRNLGNLAFGNFIQAKLKIGEPGDVYEREADHVADEVMRMPEPTVQKKCAACSDSFV